MGALATWYTTTISPMAFFETSFRYTIDFEMEHRGRHATVRSASIVLQGEAQPRLTSCFVL